jgi:formiminoglutamase
MTRPAIEHLNPPQIIRVTQREAAHERRVSNWVTEWDFEESIDVGIVGVPIAKGAILPTGADSTPNAIRKAMVYCTTYNPDLDVDIESLKVRHVGDVALHVTEVLENHRRIEGVFASLFDLAPGMVTLVVGGNGTITAPILRAFAGARRESIGMIQFDSKVDSRAVSEGGPSDATSLRDILDSDVGVSGSNVFHVGSHGFLSSPEERRWAGDRGVTLVTARQARREGVGPLVERALTAIGEAVADIYVSVDATALEMSASGSALASAPGGLSVTEMEDALFLIGQSPKVRVLDVVGIDTFNDVKEIIARTYLGLMLAFLAGVKSRDDPQGGPKA